MKRLLGLLVIIVGLHFLAESQTHGFRFYHLISNLPHDSRFETPPLSPDELQSVNERLNQSFTFLGSGGWCYAFLGEDQKTVLKFFKHIHLYPQYIMKRFSFQKLLMQAPQEEARMYYFQHFNFNSCSLLFQHAKEASGIQYMHLNKTDNIHPTITLYDPIGIAHQLDLNQTEFVLQEKAELLFPHLDTLVKHEGLDSAKLAIDRFLGCLLNFYKLGIRDDDHGLRNNFGFIGDQPVTIDLSSWVRDESIKIPSHYKKEIVIKTRRLSRWLDKYHPELHEHLEDKLCNIIEGLQENLTPS